MPRPVTELYDYQCRTIEWMLSHPQAGVVLDMGMGKTCSALTALYEFQRFGVGPTLVVAPIRVVETVWRQEAAEWEHLTGQFKFSLLRGTPTERLAALNQKADIYLVNPEHLEWLLDLLPEHGPYPFETLIIDESSMFKDVSTKRFKILRHKIRHFRRRYILTGTPRPNKLLELWPQIFILDEGQRLGTSYGRFKQRFFYQADRYGYKWEPLPGAEEKIYQLIADLVLRIENPNAPKASFNILRIPLPEDARRIYREVEDNALASLGDFSEITAANAAAAMMKCRQVANGVVYATELESNNRTVEHIHREKFKAVQEVVENTGSPVIVVYSFKHELEELKKLFAKDYSFVVLNEEKNAEAVVAAWNRGEYDIMFLHPQSGGHGLNLQHGGHTMVWFGLTFSFEQYIQTVARINRQGQKHPVIVHLLLAENTVDELLHQVLTAKEQGQNSLFEYLKAYAEAHNPKTTKGRKK